MYNILASSLLLAVLSSLICPQALFAEMTPDTSRSKFWFGSYGRVGLSTDEKGAQGRRWQITPFAPRLIEDNYIELDLGAQPYQGPTAKVTTVLTLSFFDQLFHYDGQASATIALRRAYVEAENLFGGKSFVSLGSRWLRGNDIYLLNFWPLDDLNTLGLTWGMRTQRSEAFLHVGVSRTDPSRQAQRISVPSARFFGAEEVLFLDRQRGIFAGLYERRYGGEAGKLGWKWKLYAELHTLPSGERALEGSFTETESLPDDLGLLAGFQLGAWSLRHDQDHINLWFRYARGLAIYDELGSPAAFDQKLRSWDAEELRLALAGNHVLGRLSVQWGGYVRAYEDADRVTLDFDDRVEGSMVVRPQLRFGHFTPAVEASAQLSQAMGMNPQTQGQGLAEIYQFALLPALTFGDPATLGSFSRPQLRLIYAVTLMNDAARTRYSVSDPLAPEALEHYVGARAEWWFGRGGGY